MGRPKKNTEAKKSTEIVETKNTEPKCMSARAYQNQMDKKEEENKEKPLIIHIPLAYTYGMHIPIFDIDVHIVKNMNMAFRVSFNASKYEWYAIYEINNLVTLYIGSLQDSDGNYYGLIFPSSY